MKKIKLAGFSIILAVIMILSSSMVSVFASNWAEENIIGSWETAVYIDGELLALRVQLDNDMDRSFAARVFMEHLGYSVSWDDENRSIELINDENNIKIFVGADSCEKNGLTIEFGKPVYIDHDYAYFPESFLCEVLGVEVLSVDKAATHNRIHGVHISTLGGEIGLIKDFLHGEWRVSKFLGFDWITKDDIEWPDGEDIIGKTVVITEDTFSSMDFGSDYSKYAVEIDSPIYEIRSVDKGYDFAKYLSPEADGSIRSLNDEYVLMIQAESLSDSEESLSGQALYVIDNERLLISLNCDYFELERIHAEEAANESVYIANSGDEASILEDQIYHLERGYDLSTPEKTAALYARSVKTRNGALFLVVASQQTRAKYIPSLQPNFVTGVSSPWVESYDLGKCTENKDGTVSATISFVWKTSDGEGTEDETIVMQKQADGRWIIISDIRPY